MHHVKNVLWPAARTLRTVLRHPVTATVATLVLKALLDPLVRELVDAALHC